MHPRFLLIHLIAIVIHLAWAPLAHAQSRPSTDPPPARSWAPDRAALESAPPPHRASGRAREPERDEGPVRAVGRAILWTPRELFELGLWVPDQVAGRIDDYQESKGPNVYGRGEDGGGGWSGGAMLAWEAPFGPSVGARVGHSLGRHMNADLTAIAFGRHGVTGRVGWTIEPRPDGPARVEITGEVAHDREVAFAGIGDHALGDGADLDPFAPGAVPEQIVDDRALTGKLGVPIEVGQLRVRPSGRIERHALAPDDPDAFGYDRAALIGFEEPFTLGDARIELSYDARSAPHRWIPRSAPATGWRARAVIGYAAGSTEDDGDFRYGHYSASLERLFDLYRGTRVLAVRARLDGVTADRSEVPFLLLPALGGPDQMRAFSRGRFRDETATSGEVAYEWAFGTYARASLFIEVGGVHPGIDQLDRRRLHLSSGGALRLAYDGGTGARCVLAGSSTGELGFFLVIGGV
jgi:hypothetical protein